MNLAPYRDEEAPRRELLPGGAVLLSVPMQNAHSVTLGFWLRSGSQDEPASRGGLSHFLEHIVFKGSANHTAYQLAAGFDSLGATIDAFTTKDHVAFTLKVLPEYFAPAVRLLADMLLRPAFAPEMIALEQDVVCEEIQEAFDTPEDRLHDAFAARVYDDHPRGRPILGTPEAVRGFDRAGLCADHQRLFAGPNVVIAMAGNLDEAALATVRDEFASLSAGGDDGAGPAAGADRNSGRATTEAVPTDSARSEAMVASTGQGPDRLVLRGALVQSYFEIGNRAVSYLHQDRIPVFLLSNILGGGMSSRIFQAVREREGLAYTIYNYGDMGREVGLVSCAGSCSPSKEERLQEIVRQEYAQLIASGPRDEELENNRAQLKSQLIFSLEGVVNQMYRAAKNEIFYGRFLPVAELVDRIDGIGRDDIVRCAECYFQPERLIYASHGPALSPADQTSS